MASIGSLKIAIGLQLGQLQKDLKRSEFLLNRSAQKYKQVGASLTQNITLPLLAVGGASAKMALDLDANFSKIENLVGVTGKTLQEFRSGVAAISGVVGKAQSELSQGLFAITSAGLRGSEALGVLQQSAKASEIGLGDVTEIARASTAVLNAYGKENISAARSVDVLTGIVREGNVEAETLAPSLGRVIGVAAQMGVSFEEVGASIATFTRLGVGAEEAVTGIRAVLTSFLKPTKEAADTLATLGLTAQDVRDSIKTNGLADTLIDLKERIGGNDEALATIIPNVRALSTVLGTAGSQADTYREVLDNLSRSTGIVDQGFNNVSKSAGFQFKAALVQLQNVSIELGAKLLPVLTQAVNVVSNLVSRYQSLDAATKDNIIRFAAFAAAIGPVTSAIGALKGAAATAVGVFRSILVGVTALGGPISLTIAAVAAGAVLIVKNWEKVRGVIVNVANGMIQVYNESIAVRSIVNIIGGNFEIMVLTVKEMISTFKILGSAVYDVLSGSLGLGDAFSNATEELARGAISTAEAIKTIMNERLTEIIEPKSLLPQIAEGDVDAFLSPITTGFEKVKATVSSIFSGLTSGGAGGGAGIDTSGGTSQLSGSQGAETGGLTLLSTEVLDEQISNMQKLKEGILVNIKQPLQELPAIISNSTEALKAMALSITSDLGSALEAGGKNWRDFANKTLSSIKDAIGGLIKFFVAQAISSLGPIGLIAAPAVAGLAKGIFNTAISGAIPAFANGGVVTGPTFGLFGEYAGANSPGRAEIVTPEPLMRKIVRQESGGREVRVRGVLGMREIYLLNQRGQYALSRSTFSG